MVSRSKTASPCSLGNRHTRRDKLDVPKSTNIEVGRNSGTQTSELIIICDRCTLNWKDLVLFSFLFYSFVILTHRPLTEIPVARHLRSGHPGNLLEACKSGSS